jgi:hypothetical protein
MRQIPWPDLEIKRRTGKRSWCTTGRWVAGAFWLSERLVGLLYHLVYLRCCCGCVGAVMVVKIALKTFSVV